MALKIGDYCAHSPPPAHLRIPRWQIFLGLLSVSKRNISPTNRLPIVILYLRKFNSVIDESVRCGLSVLQLNRQIYHEMITLLYPEKFFYFERCFIWPGNALTSILTPSAGSFLQHIGFSDDHKIQECAADGCRPKRNGQNTLTIA